MSELAISVNDFDQNPKGSKQLPACSQRELQRLTQDFAQLVSRERDRIALHAAGDGSLGDHGRDIGTSHAVAAKSRHSEISRQIVEECHAVFDTGGSATGEDARDLLEALYFLMELKLRHQLRQRAAGQTPGNLVQPSALSTMERDQLKGALAINKRFRVLLRQRFRLDAL